MSHGSPVTASAAEVIRNFGFWQERASEEAVHITHHGRRRLVMVSAANYDALMAAEGQDQAAVDPFFVADRVMAYSDDGFFLVDEQLRTKIINAAGCALLKTSSHEFIGRPLADLVPDLVEDVSFELARRALLSGQSSRFTVTSPRYPGRMLEFRAIPVHSCVACVFRDVTAAEQEQQGASRLLAVDQAIDLLTRVARTRLSPRGTFAEIGGSLPDLLGLPRDRLIGVRLIDVLAPEDRVRIGGMVEAVLLGGDAQRAATALLANGGERIGVDVAIAPVGSRDEAGGAIAVFAAHDAAEAAPMPRTRRA